MPSVRIREYTVTYTEGNPYIRVLSTGDYKTYSQLPTSEEANEALGTVGLFVSYDTCFQVNDSVIASPKIPDENYFRSLQAGGMFSGCTALEIAPKLPYITTGETPSYKRWFYGCISLTIPPVIPQTIENIAQMFQNCGSLRSPVSVPQSVTTIDRTYTNCSALTGEIVIRASSPNYSDALLDTVKPITLYGDRSICEAIAATANNGNASWSAWYEPVPAVTNRGQGSRTTAEDITRMVRNGVLAVDSYAPGRMRYERGDIVREDEWNALVEAAQTIDPTVTYSSNYANMNKIEAAFESAL